MAQRNINQITVDGEFYERIRENTTKQQWEELLKNLEVGLLRRMASTADADLPRLKGKVEYIGELRNFFLEFFS